MSYRDTTTKATYGYTEPPDLAMEDTGKCWVVRDQDGLIIAVTRDERIAQLLCNTLNKKEGR